MKRLYSPSTQTTYIDRIHSSIPDDAIPITEALFLSVIANPEPGKVRAHDKQGLPFLIDAPSPDGVSIERAWRDTELSALIWLRDRHRDQLEIGTKTTLTPEQFTELLTHMQALRDWPQSEQFPVIEYRPVALPWITEQAQ